MVEAGKVTRMEKARKELERLSFQESAECGYTEFLGERITGWDGYKKYKLRKISMLKDSEMYSVAESFFDICWYPSEEQKRSEENVISDIYSDRNYYIKEYADSGETDAVLRVPLSFGELILQFAERLSVDAQKSVTGAFEDILIYNQLYLWIKRDGIGCQRVLNDIHEILYSDIVSESLGLFGFSEAPVSFYHQYQNFVNRIYHV